MNLHRRTGPHGEIDSVRAGSGCYGERKSLLRVFRARIELSVEIESRRNLAAVRIERRENIRRMRLTELRWRQRMHVDQILTGRQAIDPVGSVRVC